MAEQLPGSHFNLARYGGRGLHIHRPAGAGDSSCLPQSGRKLPGTGYRWRSGEGRVVWDQQPELR